MINYEKFLKVRLDDEFTTFLLNRFIFFKYISPNLITLIGFFLNFIIYLQIINYNFLTASILLFIRWLADCLDGGVARKYNKKSKIGGLLDTISDSVLIFFSILSLCFLYNINYGLYFSTIAMTSNIYIIYRFESLTDHVGMKVAGNTIKSLYAFSVNNSFILFILKIFLIYFSLLIA
jgi:phosphatidylglycerophosphate synthase